MLNSVLYKILCTMLLTIIFSILNSMLCSIVSSDRPMKSTKTILASPAQGDVIKPRQSEK